MQVYIGIRSPSLSNDARFDAAMRKVFDIPLDDGSRNPMNSDDLKGFCVHETKRVSNLHNLFPEYRAEFRSALRLSYLASCCFVCGAHLACRLRALP